MLTTKMQGSKPYAPRRTVGAPLHPPRACDSLAAFGPAGVGYVYT